MEELKRRLEILLGAKEEAANDESEKQRLERQTEALRERQERVAEAGGQMLTAAFTFLSEMLPVNGNEPAQPPDQTSTFIRDRLAECLETDDQGRSKLTVTLPDPSALGKLAETLARLIPTQG